VYHTYNHTQHTTTKRSHTCADGSGPAGPAICGGAALALAVIIVFAGAQHALGQMDARDACVEGEE